MLFIVYGMFYFCNMFVEYSSNIYLLNLTTYVTTVLVSEHSESIQKKHSHNIQNSKMEW